MSTLVGGLLAFLVPFALSLALTCLARRLAPRLGFVDRPGGRKAHSRPVPLGGGVAMFVAWAVPVGAVLAVACALPPPPSAAPPPGPSPPVLEAPRPAAPAPEPPAPGLRDHLADLADRAWPLSLVLLGSALVMALGLADDVRELSPACRLLVQAGVAAGLYAASRELRITLFARWAWPSFVYTVVWVVGITNAFNFLDNTDGLSAGVAVVASLILAVVGVQTGQVVMTALALGLAGAAAGFLVHNFPPARVYMGDAGGLFLGFALSLLTVLFTFYKSGPVPSGRLYGVLMPLFILALPIFDTITVVAIRIREGRPVWEGDRRHFSHRLMALGMSTRETVLFIYLTAFCLGLASTLLSSLDEAGAVVIFVIGVAIFILIGLLERAGRRRH
ncbi:MAG: glycosyltransferase family 4 protein [Candidatus Brocadiia bacterium]